MVEVWTGQTKYGRINNLKTLFDTRPGDPPGDCIKIAKILVVIIRILETWKLSLRSNVCKPCI